MRITAGRIAFAALVLLGIAYVCAPMLVHAQGSGTKVNTTAVSGTTFTDSGCAPVGSLCTYQVTSTDGTRESGPSNTSNAVTTTVALPNVKITWTASTSTGVTGYYVYRNLVPPLLPPTAVGAAASN